MPVLLHADADVETALEVIVRFLTGRLPGLRDLPREVAIKLCADLEDYAHDALRDLTRYPQ